ncbi:hypothetical protein [Pandoraea pnomenusa]|uniref:hypothetical protein n=1 Tax=Pandoraea pnomenusa TaxID=93220 RepID=UPI0033423E80
MAKPNTQKLLAVSLSLFISGPALSTPLEKLEGVYVAPGRATHKLTEDGPFVPVKNATDCLVIKRSASGEAEIYMSSIQERGASCNMDGVLQTKDGRLLYRDESDPLPGQGAYLNLVHGRIKFVAARSGTQAFCGVGAGIDVIEFDLGKRSVPWRNDPLAKNPDLSTYCPAWNR